MTHVFRPGDTFLGYTIERLLGEGGLGSVWLARHGMLDTLYAAKTTGYKEKFIAHSTTHARSFTRHQREYISHVKKFVKRFIK